MWITFFRHCVHTGSGSATRPQENGWNLRLNHKILCFPLFYPQNSELSTSKSTGRLDECSRVKLFNLQILFLTEVQFRGRRKCAGRPGKALRSERVAKGEAAHGLDQKK